MCVCNRWMDVQTYIMQTRLDRLLSKFQRTYYERISFIKLSTAVCITVAEKEIIWYNINIQQRFDSATEISRAIPRV